MTALVSARTLWWETPEKCTCANPDEDFCPHDEGGWPSLLHTFDLDGAQYITDGHVLLAAAQLGELPLGYGSLLTPLRGQSVDGLATWLMARVIPAPSDRVFRCTFIDPLEAAGYVIRPLDGVKDAHGICERAGRVVGLIIPIAHRKVADAGSTARVVSPAVPGTYSFDDDVNPICGHHRAAERLADKASKALSAGLDARRVNEAWSKTEVGPWQEGDPTWPTQS